MRKVVSTDDVAHLWARQSQEDARTSTGNFYFNNETIYSYGSHFPIACLRLFERTVLFTTRTYSNTTAKHISITRSASNQYTHIYCKNPDEANNGNHKQNLEAFESECKIIAGKLTKAKKPEIYLSQIAQQRELLNSYVRYFNIDLNNSPVPLVYINILSKSGCAEATEQERIAIDEYNKRKEAQRKKEHAFELKKFRAFKTNRMYSRDNFDYLRFNNDSKRVETSQGVEIPAEVAKRFYKWVLSIIELGGCTGECEMKIMDYTVKAVSKDVMQIGCHNIKISEATKIATLLNSI